MRWLIMVLLILMAAACTTIEIKVETPTNPDIEAISTLANLMIEGTQYAQILAERDLTPEPVLPNRLYGQITGKVCYPGTGSPSMIVYFRNTITDDLIDLEIEEYQSEYSVDLLPGEYYVYAWSPQYLVGGLYSEKVLCGNDPVCEDHNPISISVEPGELISEIDICDWGFPPNRLPLPPGTLLPGIDVLLPPRE